MRSHGLSRASRWPGRGGLRAAASRRASLAAGVALLVAGCDWSEFDDLQARASVVVLERPSQSDAFGRSLAAAADADMAVLFGAGTPSRSSGAAYAIGFEQNPAKDAAQVGFCSRDNANVDICWVADGPAYVSLTNSRSEEDLCFAYGWGATVDDENAGVLVRCFSDSADITLRVPSSARSERARAYELNEENQPLWLASDTAGEWLLAALANQNRAWYYVVGDAAAPAPIPLATPASAGETFGQRAAVLRLAADSDDRLFAVSAPDAGQVWLYRATPSGAVLSGCLGERPEFGRALAAGDVDGDGADDLVVAEESLVTVFSGAALAELPQAFGESCSLAALPAGSLLGSFGCGSRLALSECSGSSFGASLAVANLDGDRDAEVIVGAPGMSVNGQSDAGAVLIYDVEGSRPHELSDVLYLSSAEDGDRMGTSVAAVPQKDRRAILAAGGPGNSKVAVFFCSDLVDPEDREGRCAP